MLFLDKIPVLAENEERSFLADKVAPTFQQDEVVDVNEVVAEDDSFPLSPQTSRLSSGGGFSTPLSTPTTPSTPRTSTPCTSTASHSPSNRHTNPNWLPDMKKNFRSLVIDQCCARTKDAVDMNEDIKVMDLPPLFLNDAKVARDVFN